MAYDFFRGTGSGPSEYRNRTCRHCGGLGFHARVCLPLAQARNLLGRCYPRLWGEGDPGTIALDRAATIANAVNGKTSLDALALFRECKREKSHGTVQVSTDLGKDCGGYASGHIFKITYPTLYVNGQVVQDQESASWSPRIRPNLISDAPTISQSTILAMAGTGKEVMFFTPVLHPNIVGFYAPGMDRERPILPIPAQLPDGTWGQRRRERA